MTGNKIFILILMSCSVATASFADIYEWPDENGAKRFSNDVHPAASKVLIKTQKSPNDEDADRTRREVERQEHLDSALREIIQREVDLQLREAGAERRSAGTYLVADATLPQAHHLRQETGISNSRVLYRGAGYGDFDDCFGCNDLLNDRWYYRKKFSRSHQIKLNHLSPYQHYRGIKKQYGHPQNDFSHQHRDQIRHQQNGDYSTFKLNSRGAARLRSNRIGSRSSSLNVRGRGSGLGMRR